MSVHLPVVFGALILAVVSAVVPARADLRERACIDRGWRFALGHAVDPGKDFGFSTAYFFNAKAASGDGAAGEKFDDSTWRVVDLPHDWAVALPFDEKADGGHGGKAIGRGYPANSVGWYRKELRSRRQTSGVGSRWNSTGCSGMRRCF